MKVLNILNTVPGTWYIKVATFLQVKCKFFFSLLFFLLILPLDPNPDSGSTDPIESGSDPDPQLYKSHRLTRAQYLFFLPDITLARQESLRDPGTVEQGPRHVQHGHHQQPVQARLSLGRYS